MSSQKCYCERLNSAVSNGSEIRLLERGTADEEPINIHFLLQVRTIFGIDRACPVMLEILNTTLNGQTYRRR